MVRIGPERQTVKPRGEAEWFNWLPRGDYSNKPRTGHSLSGLYYNYGHQHLVPTHGITAQLWYNVLVIPQPGSYTVASGYYCLNYTTSCIDYTGGAFDL